MPRLTLVGPKVNRKDEIDIWYEGFIADLEEVLKVVANPRVTIKLDSLNVNFLGLMKSLAAK